MRGRDGEAAEAVYLMQLLPTDLCSSTTCLLHCDVCCAEAEHAPVASGGARESASEKLHHASDAAKETYKARPALRSALSASAGCCMNACGQQGRSVSVELRAAAACARLLPASTRGRDNLLAGRAVFCSADHVALHALELRVTIDSSSLQTGAAAAQDAVHSLEHKSAGQEGEVPS